MIRIGYDKDHDVFEVEAVSGLDNRGQVTKATVFLTPTDIDELSLQRSKVEKIGMPSERGE